MSTAGCSARATPASAQLPWLALGMGRRGRPRARNQTGRKRHTPFLAISIAAPSPSRLSPYWKKRDGHSRGEHDDRPRRGDRNAARVTTRDRRPRSQPSGVLEGEDGGTRKQRAHRHERRGPEKVLLSQPECLPPDGAQEDHEHERRYPREALRRTDTNRPRFPSRFAPPSNLGSPPLPI
jgi:hypothetical protein